jgi:DNA polymerase III alpha subunit
MFLALIRPSKKHMIGQPWSVVAKSIWEKDQDGYSFKKSHAVAYAHLVVVHMNLLAENPRAYADFWDVTSGHSFDESDGAPF